MGSEAPGAMLSWTTKPMALPALENFARWVGSHVGPGDVLALCGELGSGKTTFVRALARALDLDDPEAVASPTYLLIVEHPGRIPLLHADAYLPQKLRAFLEEGGIDYLLDRRAVVAVEWADRVASLLPPEALWLRLMPMASGERTIHLRCRVARPWADPAAYTAENG